MGLELPEDTFVNMHNFDAASESYGRQTPLILTLGVDVDLPSSSVDEVVRCSLCQSLCGA